MATVFVIAFGIGLVIGLYIDRQSRQDQAVPGDMPAAALHYLACSALSSTTPAVVTALILGLPFVQMVGTAFSFFVIGAALLVLYGIRAAQLQPVS